MTWKTTIPRELRQVDRAFIRPLQQAVDRGVEIQAKAYRRWIVRTDSVASREFLESVRTRTVLRTQSMLIKAAGSNKRQALTMEVGQAPAGELPAHQPPTRAIMRWMPYRGMQPDKSHAFAIAISILRRGIEPRHVAEQAFDETKQAVVALFRQAVEKTAKTVSKG